MKLNFFTREERKLLADLENGRGAWDPDFRALVGIVKGCEDRLETALADVHVLNLAGYILDKKFVTCVFFDILESGKVACTRRDGLMGVGKNLHEALTNMMEVETGKGLNRLGITEPVRRDRHKDEFEE